MLKKLMLPLALTSLPALAASFDPPDLGLEYRLHQNYVQSQNKNAGMTEQPQEGWIENYSLQRGENLWNLSQMLYGDGAYWPKVWAQNRAITNPHLVRPGHKLELLLGSEDQAPSFRFSEEGDGGLELAAAQAGGGTAQTVEIPPPEIPPRPILNIPRSFPAWQEVYHRAGGDLVIDDSKLRPPERVVHDRIPLNGYVQDKAVEPMGNFLEMMTDAGLPTPTKYAYVKVNKGQGRPGQHYLIVEDHGEVPRLTEQVEGRLKMHIVEIFGDLTLVEETKNSFRKRNEREKFDVFRARILHSTGLSLTGHDLVPGDVQFLDLSNNGTVANVDAQVIGSTKASSSALYGPGDIVFLNHGSDQGVAVGQILELHTDRSIRDSHTPVTFSGVAVGDVKVVKVDHGCATAVVLHSTEGILQGDHALKHVGQESAPAPTPSTGSAAPAPENGSDELPSLDEPASDPSLSE